MMDTHNRRYVVTLYHDEPEEAAEDSKVLDTYFGSQSLAIRAAREALSDHWQSAQVNIGTWTAPSRTRPESFDYDEADGGVLVGPDWIDR